MPLLYKYRPKNCKAQPWNEIESHFDTGLGEQHKTNIAELVRHIKSVGFADRLFGIISLNRLVVSIYDPIEWDRETLHIAFDAYKSEWQAFRVLCNALSFSRIYPYLPAGKRYSEVRQLHKNDRLVMFPFE